MLKIQFLTPERYRCFMKRFLLLFLLFSSPLIASEKKTICLNMIVKNERDVITRCLESVLPIIDTWVIVDTGSTDGTQQIIRDYLKDIPGKLYERPWVDFSHNRQEAFILARPAADYILLMDADDVLTYDPNFTLPVLDQGFYAIVALTNGDEYWNPRIIKTSLDWYWEGVIHEDLYCRDPAQGLAMQGVRYVYIHDGARAKDSNTAAKDIQILQKAVKDDPNNPRHMFYLARSYITAQELDHALECFQRRTLMKGREEEVFYSKVMIARLQNMLGSESNIVEQSLLDAYLTRPHRAEPLYYLSIKLCERGEYEKAYEILSAALDLPSKVNDFMYFEKWIYEHGLLLQMAHCAMQIGRYRPGIEACEKILQIATLPENVRKETEALYEQLHLKIVARIQKKIEKLAVY